MAALRTVLVTGATGNQGGATLRHLVRLNTPVPRFSILALTRNASSDKAQALAATSHPNVTILQGNLDKAADVLKAAGKVHSIFYVTDHELEGTAQGLGFVDAAKEAGVEHFVYSTVDPCDTAEVPSERFANMITVEKHLQSSGMTYTIVQPAAFMEDFLMPMFTQWAAGCYDDTKQRKFIAVDDIGRAVATIIAEPSRFANQVLKIAGDSLLGSEVWSAFKDVTGYVPESWDRPELPPFIKGPFDFWETHEYAASPEQTRRLFPEVVDFRTWLATSPLKK